MQRQELIEKIQELPRDRLAEVEHFVELITRDNDALDRSKLQQALADYAIKYAGTNVDIDLV
jgi:hypothetical protein